jgi:hypothetical protein
MIEKTTENLSESSFLQEDYSPERFTLIFYPPGGLYQQCKEDGDIYCVTRYK